MRELTSEEVHKLASREGVRRIAVENFLSTMGTNELACHLNLELDIQSYHWKSSTVKAIKDGIEVACGRMKV